MVQGLWFKVYGSRFRVQGCRQSRRHTTGFAHQADSLHLTFSAVLTHSSCFYSKVFATFVSRAYHAGRDHRSGSRVQGDTSFSAGRIVGWAQRGSGMRGAGWVSGARMWALGRVKSAGRRGAEGVLWPFRGGFWCFLSRFRGLASRMPRCCRCRISLICRFLDERMIVKILAFCYSYSCYSCFLRGMLVSISYLYIYILISYIL